MTREIFLHASLRFLLIPYMWGGDDPIKGFDCSGLVQELMDMLGLDPKGDQTAQGLYDFFKDKSKNTLRTCGTLAFYGKSDKELTHVAMFMDDETIIEAGAGGSHTLTAEDAANQNAFVRLRPFNKRKDLVAILTPAGLPW